MRKIYWYLTAYIKKHGVIFIASLLGAIAFFSLTIPFLTKKLSIKPRVYVAVIGDYDLSSLPLSITQQLSSGLTKVQADGTVVPLLSERWAIEDEGKTYRFIVKKNIAWQDGKPLTPDDVYYHFNDVEIITTQNDVIFKLPASFSPFPQTVAEPILRDGIQKYLIFFERPTLIGIGPNKLVSYKKVGNSIKELTISTPKQNYIYRFYLTEDEALLAFMKGEVDVLNSVHDIEQIKDWPNIEVTKNIMHNQYLAVFFNNSHPNLTKNVRQALAYAIEKPDGDTRAIGPINPDSWAYLEGGKTYQKNMDRAVERILESVPSQKMEFELTTTSMFSNLAESIKQQLEEFGRVALEKCKSSDKVENKSLCDNLAMQINIKITNFPDLANFQLLLLGQESVIDPDQYFLWHSGQPTNFTQYKNTRIDSLLEKGRQAIEVKDRTAIYQEFQQFLLEDPPAIFLQYLETYDVKRN